jgi:hypothetical protein
MKLQFRLYCWDHEKWFKFQWMAVLHFYRHKKKCSMDIRACIA